MGYLLFLVLNGVLFLRPEELFPSITGLQIYYWVIVTNLVVCVPAIVNQLSGKELIKNPVTFCVLGVFLAIAASHLARFDLWHAREATFEFLKVVLYFLLLVAVINTKERLVGFLATIVVFTLAINTLAVLQYHGAIQIEALTVLMENDYDEVTGERSQIPRMCATGIFNDPNDLSMIIVASLVICGASLMASSFGSVRFMLIVPIGFLLYALTLTHSRGGLLALLAGCGAIVYVRFGWKTAFLAGVTTVPVLLAIGGRQTDISGAMSAGTGRSRTELWSEGLQMLKASPVFGVGYGSYLEHAGQVAHNSFLHTTAELGFLGGFFFLGAFAISAFTLWQLCRKQDQITDDTLRQMLPCMCGLLVAYCISMLSLSRCYVLPTYLIVGLVACYLRLTAPLAKLERPSFNSYLIQRLAIAEVAMIAFTYAFVKVAVRL